MTVYDLFFYFFYLVICIVIIRTYINIYFDYKFDMNQIPDFLNLIFKYINILYIIILLFQI